MKLSPAALKEAIDCGHPPPIAEGSFSILYNCIGDLVEIGYAEKKYVSDSFGEIDEINWFYKGPHPIFVDGALVRPRTWYPRKGPK